MGGGCSACMGASMFIEVTQARGCFWVVFEQFQLSLRPVNACMQVSRYQYHTSTLRFRGLTGWRLRQWWRFCCRCGVVGPEMLIPLVVVICALTSCTLSSTCPSQTRSPTHVRSLSLVALMEPMHVLAYCSQQCASLQ
jgi:hypothetical protein